MPRRIAAIVNPVSGPRDRSPLVQRIGDQVTALGATFQLLRTAGPGHATRLATEIQNDVDAVLVAGGDGTVCEVVNGLMAKKVPVLVYRTGTENLLARELNMPSTPRDVVRALLAGTSIPYDVGTSNDRRFLSVAGIGFDAECVLRMARSRRGHITHFDYFWPIWRTFWSHRFPPLHVEVDDQIVFEGRGFVVLGILARYSIGMRILQRAEFDDGLLDVCIFPCTGRLQFTGHAVRALAHRHIGRSGVQYHRGRHVRVTSTERVPVEVDGEAGGFLPAEFGILKHAARFLINRDGSEAMPPGPMRRRDFS